jgi:hypothetical protein
MRLCVAAVSRKIDGDAVHPVFQPVHPAFHPVHPLDQHLLSLYDKVNFLITPK